MKLLKIVSNEGNVIGSRVKLASNFYDRLVGLMFSKDMKDFDGLLIKPCKSIHTFFMNYQIDVIFINDYGEIIKIIREMKPWKISSFYLKATQVLELKGGGLDKSIDIGDKLEFVCIN